MGFTIPAGIGDYIGWDASNLLHGGERWFLTLRDVNARVELVAASGSRTQVQLTGDPDNEIPYGGIRSVR